MTMKLYEIRRELATAEKDLAEAKSQYADLAARAHTDATVKAALAPVLAGADFARMRLDNLTAMLPAAEAEEARDKALRATLREELGTLTNEIQSAAEAADAALQGAADAIAHLAATRRRASDAVVQYIGALPDGFSERQSAGELATIHAGGSPGVLQYAVAQALHRIATASLVELDTLISFSHRWTGIKYIEYSIAEAAMDSCGQVAGRIRMLEHRYG